MNIKTLLIGCFIMAFFIAPQAQTKYDFNPCGTQDGKVQWLIDYQKNKQAFPRSFDLLFIPIKIHIVGTDDGDGYFGVDKVLDAFCGLNADFAPSDIQFYIHEDFNYIDNDNFYDHTFQQGAQMMNQNNVDDVINCYIVSSPAGNCGYSSYNRGIALNKGCLGATDHTWAHEIGHFLSLPHPFYGWEGTDDDHDYLQPAPNYVDGEAVERMDGSNCHFAADGFCDTKPDYLSYRWQCSSDSLSNQQQADPDSVVFRSDGTLFMSYANDNCSGRFSDEQIDAMRANVNFDRSYLLGQMDPLEPVGAAALAPISPLEGESIDLFDSVLFEWEAIENATGYCLEISPLPSFALVQFRYHLDENFFLCNDLQADRNYFWRIRPYNAQYTCNHISNQASFSTGTISAVKDINGLSNLTVYPNPVGTGDEFRISLEVAERTVLDLRLISVTGQVIQQTNWDVPAGPTNYRLNTTDLTPGIYLLQLRSEDGVLSRKVAVQ